MVNTAKPSVTQTFNFQSKVENVIGVAEKIIHNDYSGAELSPEVSKIIITLQNIADKFPDDIKNDALVHLDDLKSDLSKPDKNGKTITTRLRSLLVVAALAGGAIAGATDFTNNVLQLQERLGSASPKQANQK
jgi:hypothetical protein